MQQRRGKVDETIGWRRSIRTGHDPKSYNDESSLVYERRLAAQKALKFKRSRRHPIIMSRNIRLGIALYSSRYGADKGRHWALALNTSHNTLSGKLSIFQVVNREDGIWRA